MVATSEISPGSGPAALETSEDEKEGDTASYSQFRQHRDTFLRPPTPMLAANEPVSFSGAYISPLEAHHSSSIPNQMTNIANADNRPHYWANCGEKERELLEDDVQGTTGLPSAIHERRMRYAADGGVRLAGGRLGEEILEDSDITSEVSTSTMPPPYLSIPFP